MDKEELLQRLNELAEYGDQCVEHAPEDTWRLVRDLRWLINDLEKEYVIEGLL